jgi:hypothetical protein
LLDLSVLPASGAPTQVFIDIPEPHFSGADRILFQEAAGICYLKIKELCQVGTIRNTPRVRLTATDIERYRQVVQVSGRRKKSLRKRAV